MHRIFVHNPVIRYIMGYKIIYITFFLGKSREM